MVPQRIWRILPWLACFGLIAGWMGDMVSRADAGDIDLPDVLVLDQDTAAEKGWSGYELSDLQARRAESGRQYLPFLNVPALRMGLYSLAVGATDDQQPHQFDETYYVVKGKAMFQAGDEKWPAQAGSVIYVKRDVGHRFYDITEDLDVLVFFSTASD